MVTQKVRTFLWLSDPERSERVMQALLQMTKLDIQKLQDAYDGR